MNRPDKQMRRMKEKMRQLEREQARSRKRNAPTFPAPDMIGDFVPRKRDRYTTY